MHLVMDILDVGMDDVLDWAGSTSRTIYCEIDHLLEYMYFPYDSDWLRVLKNSDHYNGQKSAFFCINLIGWHAFFHCSKTKHFIIIIIIIIKQIDLIFHSVSARNSS